MSNRYVWSFFRWYRYAFIPLLRLEQPVIPRYNGGKQFGKLLVPELTLHRKSRVYTGIGGMQYCYTVGNPNSAPC